MPSMKTVALSFLSSVLVIHTAFAFVANPASVSHVSSKNINNRVTPKASRTSYKLRSQKSLRPLCMAEGDAMAAAQETAKKLNDQAAALREAAASSEADIRPPAEEVEGDESATSAEAAPEIRPEDQPPKQKISNDMKDRLRKELTSQGADPNKSAGNPILIVAAVIAVLVVVGGQGIFY